MADSHLETGDNTADADRWKQRYTEIALLAGGLAHEIRNPLSTIRLNVELLGEQLESREDGESRQMLAKVERVRAECRRVDSVIGSFLQFAKAGHVEAEPHDLSELIRDFLHFFETSVADSGVEVRSHLAAGLPTVNVDEALMRQVFGNLTRNAIEAMPNGGVLEIATTRAGDDVLLDIIDTGSGMTETQMAKMFDVFYSAGKASGSGLGLPTVRKIIEAHGGTIVCDSEVGKGTRIRISLPAAALVD